MKNYWYDRAQVAVYLCTVGLDRGRTAPTARPPRSRRPPSRRSSTSDTLAPFIDEFYFEDHQQAYENFQEQFEGTPAADYVTPEVLNETFWVNLIDPSQADVIVESLAGLAGVEQVVDQRRYLDQIFDVLNAASYTAIAIAALMLVAAVLLIATTIRLSAFSRRRELGIMRLVGASNRFIQTPFMLEGVFAGADRVAARGRGGRSRSCSSSCRATSRRRLSFTFVDLDRRAASWCRCSSWSGVLLAAVSAGIAITTVPAGLAAAGGRRCCGIR